MILNILCESLGTEGRKRWSGKSETCTTWWKESNPVFEPKRNNIGRKPGIRALLMYPLNALVQDQVDGMRAVLSGKEALSFYDNVLNGNRIYFGQYSGSTLGTGSPTSSNCKIIKKELKNIESLGEILTDEEKSKVPSLDSSEILTRWDMQDLPPDILITNYSMLSIMLTREREQKMIETTRDWIKENENNIFYLVLDELHSYRGTGGTEISYIIKSFIRKIGLTPDHKQLRIICTSASLSPETGQKFLKDFFGTSEPFEIINGPVEKKDPDSIIKVKKLRDALIQVTKDSDYKKFYNHLEKTFAEKDSKKLFLKSGLVDSLLSISEELKRTHEHNDRITSYPLTISDIANTIFEGSTEAANGLIEILSCKDSLFQELNAKVRLHVFIRNVDGIRRAMAFSKGKFSCVNLYDTTRNSCSKTFAINLEASYCQECGEIYYQGYEHYSEENQYISNDPPFDEISKNTLLILHLNNLDDRINYTESWKSKLINGYTGEILTDGGGEPKSLGRFKVTKAKYNKTLGRFELPEECVACGTNWSSKPITFVRSPIRTMGTGYNKFSQILIEQVMSSLAYNSENPKLVVFSDSRKDAALLSADLELNHYKDVVRALAEKYLAELSRGNEKLSSYYTFLKQKKAEGDKTSYKKHEYYSSEDSRDNAKKLFEFLFDMQNN
jgi:hypothetical protein